MLHQFNPNLQIGQDISNADLVSIFKCGNMGGMRRSHATNTLVIVSDYTKGLYHDKWIGGVLHYTGMGKNGDQDIHWAQNDTLAKANKDYTVTYSNNTNAGTATITITGKGNYAGTKTATFTINKAAQTITAKTTASSIAVGKTATVSITGAKGTKSYKSSDTSIATVNVSTGLVTGKKAGTITITATSDATSNYNAATGTVTINVIKNLKKKKARILPLCEMEQQEIHQLPDRLEQICRRGGLSDAALLDQRIPREHHLCGSQYPIQRL